ARPLAVSRGTLPQGQDRRHGVEVLGVGVGAAHENVFVLAGDQGVLAGAAHQDVTAAVARQAVVAVAAVDESGAQAAGDRVVAADVVHGQVHRVAGERAGPRRGGGGAGQRQGGAAVVLGAALGVAAGVAIARLWVARATVVSLPLGVALREQAHLAARLGHA